LENFLGKPKLKLKIRKIHDTILPLVEEEEYFKMLEETQRCYHNKADPKK